LAVNTESNAIMMQSTGTYNSVDITASTYKDKKYLFWCYRCLEYTANFQAILRTARRLYSVQL